MELEKVNTGVLPNDGRGDNFRVAMEKFNRNAEFTGSNFAYIADMEAKRGIVDSGKEGLGPSKSAAYNRAELNGIIATISPLKGRILLPPSNGQSPTLLDQYLYLHDGVTVEGGGTGDTYVINETEIETFGGKGRLFDVGNYNPSDILLEPSYLTWPLLAGTNVATMLTPGDASVFRPGQVIWGATTERTGNFPTEAQFNRVIAIQGNALVLEYKWNQDIAGIAPYVSTSSGTIINANDGRPRRMVQDVTIRKLTARTIAPRAWAFAAGGAYNCTFEDMYLDVRALLYYNANAYCRYNRIKGTFSDRAIETGVRSHDNRHSEIVAIHRKRDIPLDGEPFIGHNENSRRILTESFAIYGAGTDESAAVYFGWSVGCRVNDGFMDGRGLTSDLIRFSGSAGHTTRDNYVGNLDLLQNTQGRVVVWGSNPTANEHNNGVENLRVHGPQFQPELLRMTRASSPYAVNVTSERGGLYVSTEVINERVENLRATVQRKMSITRTRTVNVLGISNNGAGQMRVTIDPMVLREKGRITIAGVVGVPANGTWIATPINDSTIDLDGSVYSGAYVSGGTARWRSGGVIRGLWDQSAVDLEASASFQRGGADGPIKSTDPNNVVHSTPVKADSLLSGDEIECRGSIQASGTAGIKRLALRVNGVVAAMAMLPAATTGNAAIVALVSINAASGTSNVWVTGDIKIGAATTVFRAVRDIETLLAPIRLDFVAYVENASDTIFTDAFRFVPRRAGTVN